MEQDLPVLDIYSRSPGPAGALSNFADHPFVLDGVEIRCMEGFLQSLKHRSAAAQRQVCALSGPEAKKAGSRRRAWRRLRRVWWQGRRYGLFSDELQCLIDRAYQALFTQSPDFRRALADSAGQALEHSIGKTDMRRTILTRYQFLRRLEALRRQLPENAPGGPEKDFSESGCKPPRFLA